MSDDGPAEGNSDADVVRITDKRGQAKRIDGPAVSFQDRLELFLKRQAELEEKINKHNQLGAMLEGVRAEVDAAGQAMNVALTDLMANWRFEQERLAGERTD